MTELWALTLIFVLSASTAMGAAPRCFMHGIMTPKYENKEKDSLSDMIRLHFDIKSSEEKAKCEEMMESYCINNVKARDYSPARLKGSFKPDMDKSEETTYHFSESCKLEAD
jgi:hypothetical protein